jgi:Xaa-Pro aminopeptidase
MIILNTRHPCHSGYYEAGNFGIRIETVCIVVDANTPNQFNGIRSCALETVTLVPICTNLMEQSMLSKDEVAWLDTYHARVRETLLPVMTKDFPEAVSYLIERTQPLSQLHQ